MVCQKLNVWVENFAIITATFPPVLKYFMKKSGLLETRDYVWHDFSDNELVKRHRLQVIEGDFDIDEIVQTANEKKGSYYL